MSDSTSLAPATELAARNKAHFPNENAAYREARNSLLVAEIELRRKIEAVARQRRSLPLGGVVPQDFKFESPAGPRKLSDLFGQHDALLVYSMMYGPQRKEPCPMCTSFLISWNGTARNLRERVALAVTARSDAARMEAYKKRFGFANLDFVSDVAGEYTRTYVSPEDADMPGFSVFVRRDGAIHHFYSGEMGGEMADPGQDPRGAPDLDPLWLMLDLTPEGRGEHWYPKLPSAS
ncbi:MAG TPA: DUF899 family protein [Bryobacteraceae bacterium]|jgi:predicted dithiol-disulfide oxidoreductase (DUF899 family)|nr:DUF899 family protein [Bryobacteraceae bacterium]